MIRLTLLCSAATAATRAHAFPRPDEPIDAISTGVAADLGRIDRVLAGPALRARTTAEALGLAPVIDPALDDLAVGRWTGRTLAAIEAAEPDALATWLRDPAAAPHGGESLVALRDRVHGWLVALESGRGRVVAVTHTAVIRAAILAALGTPIEGFWRIDVPPLAAVVLTGHAGRWNLRLGSDGPSGPEPSGVAPARAAGQSAGATNEGA